MFACNNRQCSKLYRCVVTGKHSKAGSVGTPSVARTSLGTGARSEGANSDPDRRAGPGDVLAQVPGGCQRRGCHHRRVVWRRKEKSAGAEGSVGDGSTRLARLGRQKWYTDSRCRRRPLAQIWGPSITTPCD